MLTFASRETLTLVRSLLEALNLDSRRCSSMSLHRIRAGQMAGADRDHHGSRLASCAVRSSRPIGVAPRAAGLRAARASRRSSSLKVLAIASTSPRAQALEHRRGTAPRIVCRAFDRAFEQRALRGFGQCDRRSRIARALVSSWPIGLPAPVKARAQHGFDAVVAFRPSALNWMPSSMKAAAQVSIRSKPAAACRSWRSPPRAAARLSGGDAVERSAAGRRDSRAGPARRQSPAGWLVIDRWFRRSALRTGDRLVERRRAPGIILAAAGGSCRTDRRSCRRRRPATKRGRATAGAGAAAAVARAGQRGEAERRQCRGAAVDQSASASPLRRQPCWTG